jgi:hypothetical protein
MGLLILISNARGNRLLWILLGYGRTDKRLLRGLILWWTIRRAEMVLGMVDKLLALLTATR